jgi:hypothetical protein
MPFLVVDGTSGHVLKDDLKVDLGTPQYFSNDAFAVGVGTALSFDVGTTLTINPSKPVDFLIVADGHDSISCSTATTNDCAVKASEAASYRLKMDNAGRIFVNYDCPSGTCDDAKWEQY